MKVAIVHDWLTGMRGGERCLSAFLSLYPDADIYTMLHFPGKTSSVIDERVVQTSFLQKLPRPAQWYRHYLPLYPMAIRGFSFEGYDLVVSLSHAAAKNIIVPKGVKHICYCFTPMRYIWDQAESYFGKATPLLMPIIHQMRRWDRNGSQDSLLIAISEFVSSRIWRCYKRASSVIYPPVDTSWIKPVPRFDQGDAFLCAGALVPYKKLHVAVQAFNEMGLPLWIAGTGPEEKRLRKMAGKNISFFGRVSDDELAALYAHSRALIFPGVEDFGMIPIECMAAGRPVIARHEGGGAETINGVRLWEERSIDFTGKSGAFYRTNGCHEVEDLSSAVRKFIKLEDRFQPEACVAQAKKFAPASFFDAWSNLMSATSTEKPALQEEAVAAC